MELYTGSDLHSRNTYINIMDKEFNRVFKLGNGDRATVTNYNNVMTGLLPRREALP